MRKLADTLGSSPEAVTQELGKINKPGPTEAPTSQVSQLPHQEILEIYLLSLIFQSDTPKQNLAKAKSILSNVTLSTPTLEKVLVHLEKYEQKEPVFSPREFAKLLPSELHVSFDTAYLAPIPEFQDPEHFDRELEKTARQARNASIKKKLLELSGLIKDAEDKKEDDQLAKYQEEFDKYAKMLSPSNQIPN